ncbi:hypothetical protein Goarm_001127 [Gossypium armourianum]|uniref:Uncharacterized protein n=1 Tax=Gossypium armourianum TaxID=34283 RepID=A0A7J9KC72_9ROSI|nr:hypothetical protein [Gossypium armourianum]
MNQCDRIYSLNCNFSNGYSVNPRLKGVMEDIVLYKQGWKWLKSQKHVYSKAKTAVGCCRDKMGLLVEKHWPMVCSAFLNLWKFSRLLLVYWKDCLGAAGAAIQNLGYTPGLFIVGLFSILILWMYANFWMTGTLFIVGGMVYFLLPDYEFFLS